MFLPGTLVKIVRPFDVFKGRYSFVFEETKPSFTMPVKQIQNALGEYIKRLGDSDLHVLYLPTMDITGRFYESEFELL